MVVNSMMVCVLWLLRVNPRRYAILIPLNTQQISMDKSLTSNTSQFLSIENARNFVDIIFISG